MSVERVRFVAVVKSFLDMDMFKGHLVLQDGKEVPLEKVSHVTLDTYCSEGETLSWDDVTQVVLIP